MIGKSIKVVKVRDWQKAKKEVKANILPDRSCGIKNILCKWSEGGVGCVGKLQMGGLSHPLWESEETQ